MLKKSITLLAAIVAFASAVDIVTFNNDEALSSWDWRLVNDPVMGGLSKSTYSIEDGIAIFDGNCAIVPKLKAPGFCNLETIDGNRGLEPKGIDASGSTHLLLEVRSTVEYKGFKISLAADTSNPQFKSFKADFDVPATGEWTTVGIPFYEFSNKWSPATGEPLVKCVDDASVCITDQNLRDISQVGLWAEGVEGDFHLEVRSISAENMDEIISEMMVPEVVLAEEEPSTEPCCTVCNDPATKKYYSIDLKHGFCGEVCMKPSYFWFFKIFEPTLQDAKGDNTICASSRYSKYYQTVTHGVGPIKITLDLFAPDQPAEDMPVDIVTFDGKNDLTTWKFRVLNDPVMGGKSYGTFEVKDNVALFTGKCAIVDKLQAPGFSVAQSTDGFGVKSKGIDASGKSHLVMDVRSSIAYTGFKISLAADTINFQFASFKANLDIPVTDDFITISVPFSEFSNKWSSATGEATVKCVDDDSVCMTDKNKKDFSNVGIWAEGVEGEFKLEVRSIRAENVEGDETAVDAPVMIVAALEEEKPASEPCCMACPKEGEEKFYSIDHIFNMCGETCLEPKKYWLYKIFEFGLHKAEVDNQCEVLGYSKYDSTVTHGAWKIKSTLDLYKPTPKDAEVDADADVDIVTFDGSDPLTTWKFRELNDPVMGGKSTGSFEIVDNVGVFQGNCAIVPSLNAPGFCKTETSDGFGIRRKGIDASGKSHAVLEVRSSIPYDGFKIAFTADTFTQFRSFKANVNIPVTDDFITVAVPFNEFSNKWSAATGEATVKCADDASVCMSEKNKKDFAQVGIWAEGHEGQFKLEIKSIKAVTMSDDEAKMLNFFATVVSQPDVNDPNKHCVVQSGLKYGMDAQDSIEQMFPIDGDEGETLATAICCDNRFNIFAEPQFLYERPEVGFFDKVGTEEEPTIFYDSACGIPVFKAPMGRSRQAFLDDTEEHGWPSFRPAELIKDNVMVLDDNRVVSKCGTMLGSFLPDEQGDRYCIDLVCVSGNAVSA